jgi:hypothetical protein
MPVLVRCDNIEEWTYALFSHYSPDPCFDNHFVSAGANCHGQCIPFEGNEALLGTTDMPSEEFINW